MVKQLKQKEGLTQKETLYYEIMKSRYGVLYITSKPGFAKSAIARSIAKKTKMEYFDCRLALVDETEVGLFPHLKDIEVLNKQGKMEKITVLTHVVPEWAVRANAAPNGSIIHFDELNRTSLAVRNAALQILLEREIGTNFKFNDNVFLMASGNLGEEDGCDTEEFDSALNNRLIHINHDLTASDWLDGYACLNKDLLPIKDDERANIHSVIASFIRMYPEELYRKATIKDGDNVKAFATPRTWTMLSKFINSYFEGNKIEYNDLESIITVVQIVGSSIIGNSAVKFIRYLGDSMTLTINDVIKNFDSVEDKIIKSNRDKKSELISSLKAMDLTKMNPLEIENIFKFISMVEEDEMLGYVTYLIDKFDVKTEPYQCLIKKFKPYLKKIQSYT